MQSERQLMRKNAKQTRQRFGLASALTLGALALLCAALFSSAAADTVRLGNLVITIDGAITPKALPKTEAAPIPLDLAGTLKSSDGTHPVALKTLDLEFDRNGHLNTKGLATCTPGKLQSTLTAQAK